MPFGRPLSDSVGAELRLAAIVQSSNDAIISADLTGIIQTWNPAAERMFGFSEAEAVGQSIAIFVPPEKRDEQRGLVERVRGGEFVSNFETTRVTKCGQRLDVSVTASPVRDASGRLVALSGILRDVTERNRAMAALRESEARFRLMADSAPMMLWMSGVDKECTYVSRGWLEFTGRPLKAELGVGWTLGIHPDDYAYCLRTYEEAFDRRQSFRMEYRVRRHDGEYRWLLDSGAPRFDPDGRFAGYIGSAMDVTEHRLAEDALSNLNHRLIESLENERSRIARELHDDFAQRMALMAMELDGLGNALRSHGEMQGLVQRLYDRAAQLSADLQAVSHNLHPGKLEYLGLVAAADVFCRDMSAQHCVTIDFEHHSVPEQLSKPVALGVFRVLQEALTNAVKHARTHEFSVALRGEADAISLEVVDRGIGFDVHARGANGLGLLSMRERLALMGGGITIDSRPGHGTAVRVHVPVQREGQDVTSV
jgi:PAS domain S-box-containing protein